MNFSNHENGKNLAFSEDCPFLSNIMDSESEAEQISIMLTISIDLHLIM